jgi:two-component system, sensor histidine kinase and response regulator
MLMHGDIRLASSTDEGTVFEIRIELDQPQESASRRGRAVIAGARLLIADAQPRSAQVMAELVRLWGMEVRVAASAAEALTILRESADRQAPFDVAVIDRALPDRRGDDLGPLVRAAPALAGTKLVLMVAAGVRGDAAAVQALGFDGYLKKPVTASTLLDALQQLHGALAAGELLTVHSVGEQRSRPLRLLIADDNPVNCRLAGIMLEKAGHAVQTVANGADALAAVLAEPFDAVLMDIQMPVMGGLEATRRIRAIADPRRAGVPIIAITANAMKGDDEDCYAAGMSGYVTKPIDRSVLLETLDRLTAAPAGG